MTAFNLDIFAALGQALSDPAAAEVLAQRAADLAAPPPLPAPLGQSGEASIGSVFMPGSPADINTVPPDFEQKPPDQEQEKKKAALLTALRSLQAPKAPQVQLTQPRSLPVPTVRGASAVASPNIIQLLAQLGLPNNQRTAVPSVGNILLGAARR